MKVQIRTMSRVKKNTVSCLSLGDVVSRPGREALRERLGVLKKKYDANFIQVNAENASGGTGLEAKEAHELIAAGATVLTLGDHTWRYNSIHSLLNDQKFPLVRPANYPASTPGKRYFIYEIDGVTIGVLNVLGRVFMNLSVDCPFQVTDELLKGPLSDCDIVLCDFHAEATSEKQAYGRYFDGRVSLVVGTHTHVPTADQRILPSGTGYVTDLGMCGSQDGVIGLESSIAIERLVTGIPSGYKAAGGQGVLQGIHAVLDPVTGSATEINRISDI